MHAREPIILENRRRVREEQKDSTKNGFLEHFAASFSNRSPSKTPFVKVAKIMVMNNLDRQRLKWGCTVLFKHSKWHAFYQPPGRLKWVCKSIPVPDWLIQAIRTTRTFERERYGLNRFPLLESRNAKSVMIDQRTFNIHWQVQLSPPYFPKWPPPSPPRSKKDEKRERANQSKPSERTVSRLEWFAASALECISTSRLGPIIVQECVRVVFVQSLSHSKDTQSNCIEINTRVPPAESAKAVKQAQSFFLWWRNDTRESRVACLKNNAINAACVMQGFCSRWKFCPPVFTFSNCHGTSHWTIDDHELMEQRIKVPEALSQTPRIQARPKRTVL